jgi:hypothetical protein
MKNNSFKKISMTSVAVVIALLAGCLIAGCQKEESFESNDLPFLSIGSDFDISNLSDEELHTIGLAFQRINVRLDKGFYKIKPISGNQINISEELFHFFKTVQDHSNRLIRKNEQIISPITRLKSGSESDPDNLTANDCIAHAISAVLNVFGNTTSVATINGWISSQYSNYNTNGLSGNNFNAVVSHFLSGSSTNVPSNYTYNSSANKIIVVEQISATSGHAGVLVSVSGSSVMYQDNQNGGYRFCFKSAIVYAYSATGISN